MTAVLFALAAGAGAVVRHGVNRLGVAWCGTLALNATGSLLLGWLVASQPADAAATVLGTGFLGSLTTFSMFAIEAVEAPPRRRTLVIGATLVLCLAAAALGGLLA